MLHIVGGGGGGGGGGWGWKVLPHPTGQNSIISRVSYRILSLGGRCCVWVNWDGRVYFLLALPVGTATIERSFSHMKMIKTRLRNRLSDENLTHLMRIAIEGPDLSEVNFNEILDIFKEKNRRIRL